METRIETQLVITAKHDNCIVTTKGDDKLNIGSITLDVSELAEFCDTLKTSGLAMLALAPEERVVALNSPEKPL